MYGYIYLTTNLINGKKYIGQHKSKIFVEDYKGSGVLIKKAINKYGSENFKVELIEECFSQDELNQKEVYWINKFDAVNDPNFYNIAYGGYGNPFAGKTEEEMEEIRRKMSESSKGEKHPFYNKKHSEETLEKMRQKQRGENHPLYGKKHSEETKKKISKSMLGKGRGKENGFYGKTHTEEARKRIAEAARKRKGRVVSEETRRKISESLKKRKSLQK